MNAVSIKESSLRFACHIARLTSSELTGLFLENLVEDEELVVQNAYDGTYIDLRINKDSPQYLAKSAAIEKNINRFQEICHSEGVRSSVCKDERRPVHEAVRESRFADLLIVDPDIRFKKSKKEVPSRFVTRVLRNVACPVIVAPEHMQDIKEVIFAYDGSRSSMFAIRQFTYVLPVLGKHKLTVLNVSDREEAAIMLPQPLKEWLEVHYTSFIFDELHVKRLDILVEYLAEKKNAMIVIGAYGRNRVSRLLRESAVDVCVRKIDLPFFIVHY